MTEHVMAPQTVGRYAWYALAVLALVNCLNYTDRWAISVLLQPIKQDLALSDAQLGILTGFAFSLSYALFALPLARWADRGSRRTVLVLSISIWSAMTALTGLAQNFWQLLLGRVGVGMGESGCIPTCQSLISDYFPKHARPFALSVFTSGAMAGKVVGIGVVGLLVEHYGWRMALFILAVPGLFVAAFVRASIAEPPRGQNEPSGSAGSLPMLETIRTLIARRSFVLVVLGFTASNMVLQGIQIWTPSFYMRQYGMSASHVGAAVAGGVAVGSAVGLFFGGYATQQLMKRDARWATRVAGATQALLIFFSMGIYFADDVSLSLALFAGASIAANIPLGAVFATLLSVAPPHARAFASAIALALTSIIGLGLGPLIVGAGSDMLAPLYEARSLQYALMSVTVLYALPCALYLMASRTLLKDIANAEGER